jgi:hypothetical protein
MVRVWVLSAARVVSAVLVISDVSGLGVDREIAGKGIQTAFPEGALACDPFADIIQGCGFQSTVERASVPAAFEKASLFENFQMFRDGRQGHRKRFGQFADTGLAGG